MISPGLRALRGSGSTPGTESLQRAETLGLQEYARGTLVDCDALSSSQFQNDRINSRTC